METKNLTLKENQLINHLTYPNYIHHTLHSNITYIEEEEGDHIKIYTNIDSAGSSYTIPLINIINQLDKINQYLKRQYKINKNLQQKDISNLIKYRITAAEIEKQIITTYLTLNKTLTERLAILNNLDN